MLRSSRRLVILIAAALAVRGAAADPASDLSRLLAEPKFGRSWLYTGPDTPEDGIELTKLVNAAITDVTLMTPRSADAVRARLKQLIKDVDLFATEDRQQAYRYAVRTWRAAGLKSESQLFPVPDAKVVRLP